MHKASEVHFTMDGVSVCGLVVAGVEGLQKTTMMTVQKMQTRPANRPLGQHASPATTLNLTHQTKGLPNLFQDLFPISTW